MTMTGPDMALTQPLAVFVEDTGERLISGSFSNETARILRVDVDGGVWLKPGAAISYRGDVTFERRATLGATGVEDAVLRETAPLVRASGSGRLFCASHGAHVRSIRLADEALVVSWQDLLAFEETLDFEVSLVGHGVGLAAGGLASVRLSGCGSLAITTHGSPITLEVRPGAPVFTDPHATIAWSSSLSPTLKTDLSWRSALGHGGHEPFQMAFDGHGFVVIQAYEDPARIHWTPRPLKQLSKLVTG